MTISLCEEHVVQLFTCKQIHDQDKARMTLTTISKRVEDEPYDAAGSYTHTHTHTHIKHIPEAHRKSEIIRLGHDGFSFKEVRKYRKEK